MIKKINVKGTNDLNERLHDVAVAARGVKDSVKDIAKHNAAEFGEKAKRAKDAAQEDVVDFGRKVKDMTIDAEEKAKAKAVSLGGKIKNKIKGLFNRGKDAAIQARNDDIDALKSLAERQGKKIQELSSKLDKFKK
ncbi:MAG: hypothetical protein QM529_03765 [Hydrotalea sp.]|nr:hypothetical protein [Hydrotalea sp.]